MANRDPKFALLRTSHKELNEKIGELLTSVCGLAKASADDLVISSSLYSLVPDLLLAHSEGAAVVAAIFAAVAHHVQQYVNATMDPSDRLWAATNNGVWCVTRMILDGCSAAAGGLAQVLLPAYGKSVEDKPPLTSTIGICLGVILNSAKTTNSGLSTEQLGGMARSVLAVPQGDESKAAIAYENKITAVGATWAAKSWTRRPERTSRRVCAVETETKVRLTCDSCSFRGRVQQRCCETRHSVNSD